MYKKIPDFVTPARAKRKASDVIYVDSESSGTTKGVCNVEGAGGPNQQKPVSSAQTCLV